MEPLSRGALRHRVARLLVLVLARAGTGVGLDGALRDASRRSFATPTMSPIASTSAATSVSRRASTSAMFEEGPGHWVVSTDHGDEVSAQFLLMATGCLSTPKLPEIDGIDTFGGATYHTATWPHEGVDVSGRRVAVIGTGSSGIQAIPIIAEQAAWLTVFQRTPAYSTPAHNRPLDPDRVARPQGELPGLPRAGPDDAHRCRDRCRPAERLGGRLRRAPTPFSPGLGRGDAVRCRVQVQRHPHRSAGERVGERVPPPADPRDRRRPRGCRTPVAADVPVRHQAPMPRHWLLRDVQQTQRRPRRCPGHADHRDKCRWHPHVRTTVRPRRHRVRHRVRRPHGAAARRQPGWCRRVDHAGEVVRRTAHLPRPGDRRVPEPVPHHRTGQPVRPHQRDGVDRTSRRLDRRPAWPPWASAARRESRPTSQPRRVGSIMSTKLAT